VSALGGLPVERVELAMGRVGSWRADVTLTSGEIGEGPSTLVIGDLQLLGTVVRAGLDSPDRPRAVVVGAPGWERELARPLSYQSDAGVRLASVLKDLSARSEEPIEQPSNATLGSHFAAPATSRRGRVRLRDVLATLHRMGHVPPWRVDPDGVTRFGARVGVEVAGRVAEMERNAGLGMRRLGIDDPLPFLPGATLGGETITRLVVRERGDAREALVWT
jgi:hypothetical protein